MKTNSKIIPRISHEDPYGLTKPELTNPWTGNSWGSSGTGGSGTGSSGTGTGSSGTGSSGKWWSPSEWLDLTKEILGIAGGYVDSQTAAEVAKQQQSLTEAEKARLAADKANQRTNYTPWIIGGVALVVVVLVVVIIARRKK